MQITFHADITGINKTADSDAETDIATVEICLRVGDLTRILTTMEVSAPLEMNPEEVMMAAIYAYFQDFVSQAELEILESGFEEHTHPDIDSPPSLDDSDDEIIDWEDITE